MLKVYEKLFSSVEPPKIPEGLFGKIMSRIQQEKRYRRLRRRIIIFSFGLIASAGAIIPVFKMAQAGFAESGFWQFFSLLFSDFEVVTAYWQSFALSLLETLPVMSLIMLSAATLVFFGILRFLTRDIKSIFASVKLTN
ncbi:MAG: hypothetical protein PHN39_02590 [Candidatus Pacebacteria bacterium]|nr:hypothetical protein [Candidatus Paceibacterota bacterium]